MKAGNLWHYAAFLLQLCYVCRGPLKPSIFRFNVGLYTHTRTFFSQMCVWWCFVAAKRLFRFSLHAGAIDSSHNSELADCSTSYETTSNSHILLLLTIYFRPNSKKKKGFIILIVCMYI